MRREGFTLVELVVSLFLSTLLLGVIVMTPRNLIEIHELATIQEDYVQVYNTIQEVLQKDISSSGGMWVIEGKEVLKLNNIEYEFTPEGLYRTSQGKRHLITNLRVFFDVQNTILRVYSDSDSLGNKINLELNLNYSFLRGGFL